MPTYNYKCKDCEHLFSVIQSIKDDPLVRCPKCGGTIRRVISGGSGLIFKGTGFYITDYARSNAYKSGEKIKRTKGKTTDTKPGGATPDASDEG